MVRFWTCLAGTYITECGTLLWRFALTEVNSRHTLVSPIKLVLEPQEIHTLKRTITFLLAVIVMLPLTTLGQSRSRTTKTPTRSAKAPVVDKKIEGARHLADQLKTLTRFIYILGGVAKGLEGVDDAERRNEASPAVLEQAKKNKVTVRTSIQSVREGLDQLEGEFSSSPDLRRYYTRLAGVAAGAAAAEQQAAANQFDRAGRSLLEVVNRLTDVLLEMQR